MKRGVIAVTAVGQTGSQMQRGKGIRRDTWTHIDILSYGEECQFLVAAEKIHMGIAQDHNSIFPVMAQAGMVEIGLFQHSVGVFCVRQSL